MTAEYPQGDEPLIPMPALALPALRQAVAVVAPSRLPEFFQEIQDAFTQAGDEDSVFPIRHFYQRWGAAIAIERRPSVAARLHAAERARPAPAPAVRDQAVREAAEIVQAAYRERTRGHHPGELDRLGRAATEARQPRLGRPLRRNQSHAPRRRSVTRAFSGR